MLIDRRTQIGPRMVGTCASWGGAFKSATQSRLNPIEQPVTWRWDLFAANPHSARRCEGTSDFSRSRLPRGESNTPEHPAVLNESQQGHVVGCHDEPLAALKNAVGWVMVQADDQARGDRVAPGV